MNIDKLLTIDDLLNKKLIETLESIEPNDNDATTKITIAIQLDNMRKTNIDKIFQVQDWTQALENAKTK